MLFEIGFVFRDQFFPAAGWNRSVFLNAKLLFHVAQAVLHMASGGKDLISAGLIGICISQRPDIMNKSNAKQHLAIFLKDYSPTNDDDRTIYEYCKTELERLSK